MLVWSVVLVVFAISVLGFFAGVWLKGQMGRKAEQMVDAGPVIQRHKVSEFASPSEQEALDQVKTGLALRDPTRVAEYFRLGAVKPEEVVSFLANMEAEDGGVTGYQWLSSMDANHLLIDGVLVSTELDGKARNRLAFLTPDESGKWKIDFDAFARTVHPSWEELLAPGGGKGLVRVVLARDSYFNGPFRDESEWTCYGMASPDSEMILLGYCRKNSPQEHAMSRIFHVDEEKDARGRIKRATLELQRPEGAELRQFEIIRVLAEDWVLSGTALDGTRG
jgi:hypothetical protein